VEDSDHVHRLAVGPFRNRRAANDLRVVHQHIDPAEFTLRELDGARPMRWFRDLKVNVCRARRA
jgi:hypothetical protein